MDDSLRIWNLKHPGECTTVSGFPSDLGILACSPDGRTLAVNEATLGVVAVDLAQGERRSVYPYPASTEFHWSCYSVSYGWGTAYSPDGKRLAAGGSHNGYDGFVTLWDTESRIGSNLYTHESPVTAVSFSRDGKAIASARLDGTVRLWDQAEGKERFRLSGQCGSSFSDLCFSSDGERLVTAHKDRTIRLWDSKSGLEQGRIGPHQGKILCFALSPDDRLLAVSDDEGNVLLREVTTGRIMTSFVGHRGPIWTLAFSPDGRSLATGGEDHSIRIWNVFPIP